MEKTSLKPIKTKASKSSSMKLQPIIFLTFLSLALVSMQSANVQAQTLETPLTSMERVIQSIQSTNLTGETASLSSPPETDTNDLVVLSHRFEDSRFSSEVIGEIMNNSTRSFDKFDIDIYANFRDSAGMLVSSEQGFIDAEELGPGQSSAFNVFIYGEDLADRASSYDLIINDDRLVSEQPLGESFSISSDIGVAGGSSGNDNGNSDNGGDNSPECDENERVNPSTGECEGFACIPEDLDCDGDMDPPFVPVPEPGPIEDEEDPDEDDNDNDDGDESEGDDGGESGGGELA